MSPMDDRFNKVLERIPQVLQQPVLILWRSILQQLSAQTLSDGTTRIQQNIDHLPRLLCCSEFCGRLLQHNPGLLLQVSPTLSNAGVSVRQPLLAQCQLAVADATDEVVFIRALRQFRQQQMFIIAWNDLCLAAGLEQTVADVSELADACLQVALAFAHKQIRQRFGAALASDGVEPQLIVLGLGKLGGKELNFSSDIDLILAYSAQGSLDKGAALSHHEYFTRVARKLVRYLDEVTADGFVFRVDLRLRPNGESGSLVLSTEAMEHYYEGHG
ncbi:MAG TPA: bifunctional glutamine synthetase adenylyltransferase/deadenyltransferase, partial [Gammaproteobacteria bacterium]|nr:bifunctional glutamine synthetase adenylyltransferase/deadenyltransferase [Gammaproteobacteria bacterium]